jgi:hypothetical protein
MTLKEKFKLIEDNAITRSAFYDTQVQIADDYAIEFAEWLLNSSYFFNIGMKEMTFEQVLQIFKKEKGL